MIKNKKLEEWIDDRLLQWKLMTRPEIEDVLREAFALGKEEGISEEASECDKHCKEAKKEAYQEVFDELDRLSNPKTFALVYGDGTLIGLNLEAIRDTKKKFLKGEEK